MLGRFLLHNQFDLFAQLLERMNQHQHRRNHPGLCLIDRFPQNMLIDWIDLFDQHSGQHQHRNKKPVL